MRILIVEDYLRLLRLYQKVLTHAGHEVHKAETLSEAREVLTGSHFDVCLLDVHLGFRSSLELIAHLPELNLTETRFIVVSGWDQYREICEAVNVDFYLKPISNKDLIELISEEGYEEYLGRNGG